MIDRLLILLFFLVFLFFPIIKNFDINKSENNIKSGFKTKKTVFKNYHNINSNNEIVDAIEKVSESVVGISVINIDKNKPAFEFKNGIFIPYTTDQEIKTLGSGLIYSNNGYVITNTHVEFNLI